MNGLQPLILFTKTPVSESGRTAYEIRNKAAFAAIRDDGSVVTWGDPKTGGDSSKVIDQLDADVAQIFATRKAFAALKTDGSVITWGDRRQGGNSENVKNVDPVERNAWFTWPGRSEHFQKSAPKWLRRPEK